MGYVMKTFVLRLLGQMHSDGSEQPLRGQVSDVRHDMAYSFRDESELLTLLLRLRRQTDTSPDDPQVHAE
jgi:hypothetical protein